MSTSKKTVGVIFGSRSVEHDVSIVTAQQIMSAMDPAKYEVVPIYILRNGRWVVGEGLRNLKNFQLPNIAELSTIQETHMSGSTGFPGLITPPIAGRFSKSKFQRLDVVFPAVHGSHGEDGTLQGLLEMADMPYVGTGVLASALANNKIATKALLRQYDVQVIEGVAFSRYEWLNQREAVMERVDELGYPAFVKPATLGSSIGVARVDGAEKASTHIDIAANFDRQVVVERALVDAVEINCSVMGYRTLEASVLEQPMSAEEFLTYEEKYMRGDSGEKAVTGMKGAERVIPAPISEELTAKVQDIAKRAFAAIQGHGIARIDFMVRPDTSEVWLNEINTMPGSLSFYLWEASNKTPAALVDELIQIALNVHADKRQTTYNYQNQLLALASNRGLKGAKE
jgi:D-alanine-D-alanine ligase